jgi:hypothetical protein
VHLSRQRLHLYQQSQLHFYCFPGRSVRSQSIGLVDANTLGVYATISAYGVSFTTAFNKNYGASAAVNSVGGGPFFTSMEQMTLDAVNAKNAQALFFNLEYQPLDELIIGAATGDFQGENTADFHTQEVNAYLGFNFRQILTVNFMYAYIKDLQAVQVSEQIRVILGFQF